MIISSVCAVDSRKAWTDSQHCNQQNDLQVPTTGFLCQEGRKSRGELTRNLIPEILVGIKFGSWIPNRHCKNGFQKTVRHGITIRIEILADSNLAIVKTDSQNKLFSYVFWEGCGGVNSLTQGILKEGKGGGE